MTHRSITIAELEALANEIVDEVEVRKNHLATMIRHYARILAVREPERFQRRAVEHSDEDGHWDNSFPPDIKFKDRSGPISMIIFSAEYDEIATSEGFCHDWRAATSDPGLYVTPRGELLGAHHDGGGSFGQFAAYPGECNVMVEIEYGPIDMDELSVETLEQAEEQLRELAFPLIAERMRKA